MIQRGLLFWLRHKLRVLFTHDRFGGQYAYVYRALVITEFNFFDGFVPFTVERMFTVQKKKSELVIGIEKEN